MTEKEEIETLVVPAGIGDNLWVLQTLDPNRKYNFEICAGKPQRGKQIFDLVPSMVNSVKYTNKKYPQDCTYQVNKHLEDGNHISTFRTDGFVNWNLPFEPPAQCRNDVRRITAPYFKHDGVRPIVGIYASSIKANKALGGWGIKQWYDLLGLIQKECNVRFAIIGASYDDLLGKGGFHVACINEDLGTTIEILEMCDLVIGFQSGIPILSSYFGVNTLMMFADKLHDMKNTFCRNETNWQAMSFDTPQVIFDKLIEREWL